MLLFFSAARKTCAAMKTLKIKREMMLSRTLTHIVDYADSSCFTFLFQMNSAFFSKGIPHKDANFLLFG